MEERGWQHHDTPVKLALALSSEGGELAEILAWSDNVLTETQICGKLNNIAQELADITILLVRFASLHDTSLTVLYTDSLES